MAASLPNSMHPNTIRMIYHLLARSILPWMLLQERRLKNKFLIAVYIELKTPCLE